MKWKKTVYQMPWTLAKCILKQRNTMNNNQMDSETKKKIEENCLGPQNDEVTNTAKDISIFFFREPWHYLWELAIHVVLDILLW